MIKLDKNGKVRTDAYVGTFSTECSGDMLEVESIKNMVKHMNKELKYHNALDKFGRPIRFRTTLKARKPINKVINRRTGKPNGYTAFGDVIGGMANAAEMDVYIHRYISDAMWKMGKYS